MAISTQEANLFELSCDGTRITYSTSSFAGPPQFTYSSDDGDFHFSGTQIETASTALGTEVTVTIESSPDLRIVSLTLLLPSFRLPESNEASFDTLAIKTTQHETIAGPPEGAGASYEAIALHGVAKAVAF
jgi:hypothetical protein